ncbi:MAG: hypothetical protein SFV24_21005 [Gemmatimonadales bacterium]|nr:hypothetical protein [Gemmatimonadales bacterium]
MAIALLLGFSIPLAGQPRYDLLVSSRATNSVKRYDGETGAFLGDFIAPGAGGLSLTQEVRIGPDGNVFVTGRGNSTVLRFDRRTGAFLGPVTSGYPLDQPTKMTIAAGRIYVSQWGQTRSSVATFDATTGAFLAEETPNIGQPMQHLVEPGGLLVANFETRNVFRFGPGNAAGVAATTGRSLQGPVNLWRHSSGDLLVVDWTTGSVERFDGATGGFRGTFITGLTTAEGWAVGPDGRLYLADWSRNLILRYDAESGAPDGVFASGGGLSQPNSLAFIERTPAFELALQPDAVTIAAGQTATALAIVAADRGLAFPTAVTLSCADLPVGWSCQAARAALPRERADTVTLTIRTSSQADSGPARVAVWLGALGWLGIAAVARRGRRARTMIVAASLAGCGGSPSGPPEGASARITVIARGDGLERAASLIVTVTP